MRAISKRLTYANVISTIALFLVLGGATAFAAKQLGKNTVVTKQIKKSAVTSEKVKDGSLTGVDINLATLGAVPSATKATSATRADTAARADSAGDASTLQGKAANAFIQGSGQITTARRELTVGQLGVAVLALPGIGTLTADCTAGPEYKVAVVNSSGTEMDFVTQSGSDLAPNGGVVANGGNVSFNENLGAQVWRAQVSTRGAAPSVATLTVSFRTNAPAPCTVFAQASIGS